LTRKHKKEDCELGVPMSKATLRKARYLSKLYGVPVEKILRGILEFAVEKFYEVKK